MCKRYEERDTTFDTTVPAVYDGDTMRLGDQRPAGVAHKARRRCGGGFPWWTLWLIWPAIGLFKLIAANAVTVVGSVDAVTALQVVAALVLIVAGIVLLRRDRVDRSEPWQR